MTAPELRDFEIHVGFPDRSQAVAQSLVRDSPGEGPKWKLSKVGIVMDGYSTHDIEDAHDVENLAALATCRSHTVEEACEIVDRVAVLLEPVPGARIEMEQVLLSQTGKEHRPLLEPDPYVPIQAHFKNAILIPETPHFEMHLGVRMKNGKRLHYNVSTLMDLAERWRVPIHQGVYFTSKEKITFTTFFKSFDEMQRDFHVYGDRFRSAVKRFDPHLETKLVAERIVLCAKP